MKRLLFLTILATAVLQSAAQTSAPGGKVNIVADPGIKEMHQAYIEQKKEDNTIEGYRVQFYNGRKSQTIEKRSEFLNVFPSVPVYTLYESPEYKVQAGDFRTRLEAERFLKKVIQEFGSGFVVKTRIKPPKLEMEMDAKR